MFTVKIIWNINNIFSFMCFEKLFGFIALVWINWILDSHVLFCLIRTNSRNKFMGKRNKVQLQYRSIRPDEFCLKGFFKVFFLKIHRKTPVLQSVFNKLAGLRPATLLKRDSDTGVYQRNFEKCLRAPVLQNTSPWLLLIYTLSKILFNRIIALKLLLVSFFEAERP